MNLQALRGATFHDENAGSTTSLVRQKESFSQFAPNTNGKAPLTGRKAFANLTNASNVPNSTAKQPNALPEKRRAFGDALDASQKENSISLSFDAGKQSRASAKLGAQAQALPSTNQHYGDHPIEGLAGKSWKQLERDRLVAQEADINATVLKVTAALQQRGPCMTVSRPRLVRVLHQMGVLNPRFY